MSRLQMMIESKSFKLFGLGSLVVLGTAGAIASTTSALEYQKYQRIDFTFNPAIEVSVSDDLTISELMPGGYKDSNVVSVNSSTNVASGLKLTATVGRNDASEHISQDPNYVDPYNTTNLVDVTNANNGSNFASLSANASSLSDDGFGANRWGYAYCTSTSETCNSDDTDIIASNWKSGNITSSTAGYNGLPIHTSTGILLADTSDVTDNTIYFKIGAKASNTQIAGTYTNIINFTATTNIVTTNYKVMFNNQNGATDWPSNVVGENDTYLTTTTDTTVPLGSGSNHDTAPVRANYNFLGWCTVQTTNDTCAGDVYQANETYPINNTGSDTVINLYAIWKNDPVSFNKAYANAGKQKLNNYYKMQDMSSSICSAITTGEESQLIDIRDNKVYYVAKLADDKCWMTQNLDHDISTEAEHYTYANTDIGHGSTISTSAKWTAPDDVGTWSNTTADSTVPHYTDPDDLCWDGTPGNTEPDPCGQIGHHYHLGNYYNWTAVIAMSDSSSYGGSVVDVDQSICPAGWTLPRGGAVTATTNDFVNLLSQPEYGWSSSTNTLGNNKTMWGEPLYFALGGVWGGSLYRVGSDGYYWSSTVNNSNFAYYLYFGSGGSVLPGLNYARYDGFPIRCVVRP